MRKLKNIAFIVGLILGALLSFHFVYSKGKGEPLLTVKYLTETNIVGVRIARFAVTNIGDAPAIAYNMDEIEIMQNGLETGLSAGCSRGLHRLGPGMSDVLKVPIPPGYAGLWRLHCLYAHEGIRSWYLDSQSKSRMLDFFIPSRFKLVPMDVQATSEWIYELNTGIHKL